MITTENSNGYSTKEIKEMNREIEEILSDWRFWAIDENEKEQLACEMVLKKHMGA